MSDPLVTLVFVPRERFSRTQRSMESILEHTRTPHRVVVVDGGSYRSVRNYLAAVSRERGFTLVRTKGYLSPNRARNLGLAHVTTRYVVFIDNDVIVSPGWLDKLVACAEQTGADCVAPLICQGEPLHTEVHCGTGEITIHEVQTNGRVERRGYERIDHNARKLAEIDPPYRRCPNNFIEFHCLLCRTDLFDRVGKLDEGFLNTREHIDLSLLVQKIGGTMYFEPESVVTHLLVDELTRGDLPFYRLRWSEHWQRQSILHLAEKWNLAEDGIVKARLGRLHERRLHYLVYPTLERHPWFAKLPKAERIVNHYHRIIAERAARRYRPPTVAS